MEKKRKNRWYDAFPDLSDLLESLKELEKSELNALLRKIKKIILDYDHDLINRTVMSYPLGIDRRWYDKDPLCWMTINALKFADENLRNQVTDFLRTNRVRPRLESAMHTTVRK
jgi:hypothetical protein